ncbi:ABC transporter ATP-binding protein/permease [bacterium]|nr:ABC transporter ATP-binding protein/permease [bacterium]
MPKVQFVENLLALWRANKRAEPDRIRIRGLIDSYRTFGRHYRKYWKLFLLAGFGLIATVGVSLLQPWPLKLILDHLILQQPFPEQFSFLETLRGSDPTLLLLALAVSVVVIAVLKAIFSYLNKYFVSSTGHRIVADIRERVFVHLQRLSLSFHDSMHSGNLVYTLTSDISQLKMILISFPQDLCKQMLGLFTTAFLMLALDWRLALIGMSTMPIVYLMTRFFGAGLKGAMQRKRKQEGGISSLISENVQSMALVQAYGREKSERDRFSVEAGRSLDAQLQGLRLHQTYSRLTDLTSTVAMAMVLYFGGRFAFGGDILPGTLVVFVAYLREVLSSVEKFNSLFLGLASSQVASERIMEVIGNEMIVKDAPSAVPAPALKGHLKFDSVSFAYRKGKRVLEDLNFEIMPGETIALVGHSGAGKSTLISLLLRFYDPQQGRILIDGRDSREFTIKSLRDQITILLQDAKLFRQSVADNIAFGKKGATREEVIAAAKMAQAHEFIMDMPDGYDTLMYEGGENLSGGQKQRINIARAIIRNTALLILDEPSTGLDAKAEAQIATALSHLTGGKTTFIIAHRFSTIKNADRILLLEEGQLAHFGTHERLFDESEQYRELYEIQFGNQRELATNRAHASGTNNTAVVLSEDLDRWRWKPDNGNEEEV